MFEAIDAEDDPLRPRRGEGRRPRRLRGDRRGARARRRRSSTCSISASASIRRKLNRRALEALVHAGALDALGRNRASLMLQLPEVLKATDQLAREREAGQVSLFGGDAATRRRCTHRPARSRRMAAGAEAAAASATRSATTSAAIRSIRIATNCAALVGHDLGDLDRSVERAPRRTRAAAGARKRRSSSPARSIGMRKRGDSQAFVQIEDGRGRLECAFFAEAYYEFAPLLTRDRILVIEGGLREDEFSGGFSLRAQALLGLRAGVQPARAAPVAEARPAPEGRARRTSNARCIPICRAQRRCCSKRSPRPRSGA